MKNKKIFLNLFFLLTVFSLGFFAFSAEAQAATYYVATDGSDSNNGSISTPWATFNYAISQMSAGDTLIAKAGTYNQTIDIMGMNGTALNPITIQGELDGSGNRLSILDTSTTVTGWVSAPEIGPGVWKKTGLGTQIRAMNIVVGSVPYFVNRLHDTTYLWGGGSSYSSATAHIAKPSDELYISTYQGGINPNYWDGVEVHFASPTTAITYIKFRNGNDPNGFNIKGISSEYAINIVGSSYIDIKNFDILASTYGIKIQSTGGGTVSHHITIDNNNIHNGARKIYAAGPTSYNHIFSNNIVYGQTYAKLMAGVTYGSWDCDWVNALCTNDTAVHERLYQYNKYAADTGDGGRAIGGIQAYGNYHKAFGNTTYDLDDGITLQEGNYFEIYNNTMSRHSSLGTYLEGGTFISSSIHDNTYEDCNISIRFGSNQNGGGPLYIYHNKSWLPQNAGRHVYWHFDQGPGAITNWQNIWFYYNSFSGGRDFQRVPEWAINWSGNPYKDVRIIDNIISTPDFDAGNRNADIAVCANNWISGKHQSADCAGGTNIDNGLALMWNTPTLHNFIPTDNRVFNTALDLFIAPYNLPGGSAGGYPNIGWYQVYTDTIAPSIPHGVSVQ